MYIVCSNDIIQSFEVFVNRSKDQEKGVESLKRCEKEANVSMCMGFVDFHPSVWCSSKGLFHILFMLSLLYTLRKPSYPFGPKTACGTVGRISRNLRRTWHFGVSFAHCALLLWSHTFLSQSLRLCVFQKLLLYSDDDRISLDIWCLSTFLLFKNNDSYN